MTKLTQKYFDRLHQLLMQDTDYKAGYEYACYVSKNFERLNDKDLSDIAQAYSNLNMAHAHGLARRCVEILQARKVVA